MNSLLGIVIHVYFVTEIHTLTYSYTVDNHKLCMTDCVPYNGRHFCYLGWGSSNWDYCTPGTTPALQYYTSLYKENRPLCTSLCGKFGYDYNWCFTGESGYYDYCSDQPGRSIESSTCVKPCHRYEGTYYYCTTGIVNEPPSLMIDNPGFTWHKQGWDYCAPDPVNMTQIVNIGLAVVSRPGEFTESGYRELDHCIRTKRTNDTHPDVDQLAAELEATHSIRPITAPSVAVTSFTCMDAPPLGNQYQELLTLVVRARIYRRHLNNPRDAIPGFIGERMSNMNAVAGDEQGHLLASSLGGPTQQFNFVPQSARVNRGSGGPSYWFNIEGYIRRFLRDNPNGHVDWTLVIAYGDLNRSRRPIGFALRFRQYDANDNLVNDSGNCYFTNGSTNECEII